MTDDQRRPVLASEFEALFRADPVRVAELVGRALADERRETELPAVLDRSGMDPERAIALITPALRGGARDLGHPGFLAHMDPPTPWVTWIAALLGASTNQNLLHPDTAPAARELEATVVGWLAPLFAMGGGHLVPGSTVANLTALWAARDLTGADTVVASAASHLSIRKAAAILGLGYRAVTPTGAGDPESVGAADLARATSDPSRTIVVPTAGTTGTGAIDGLDFGRGSARPAWVHVDAAWAGPLRLSDRHRHLIDGIDQADSVSISAHKWLFQPKESALVLFKELDRANRAVSVDGAYLQVPNVGLLGSHGTAAAPLAATLLLLGRNGVARLIDHSMAVADRLAERVERESSLEAAGPNRSGVVAWRHRRHDSTEIRTALSQLQTGTAFVSTVDVDGTTWLRSVAANPMADPDRVVDAVLAAAAGLEQRPG